MPDGSSGETAPVALEIRKSQRAKRAIIERVAKSKIKVNLQESS
jgi:hypothetical protein